MNEITLPAGITAVNVNGLDAFRIDTPLGRGLVYALGAHVAGWAPAGAGEVLWVSDEALFQPGRAIRGGVPICFPWFGPGRDGHHSPAHGFARTSTWQAVAATVDEEGRAVLTLQLTGDMVDELGGFPADFTARMEVTMAEELRLAFTVIAGGRELDFEEALHTYLGVADVRRVRVEGLEGARYLDKLDDAEKVQQGAVVFTGETDRVYFSEAACTVDDPAGGRRIELSKERSAQTVVWNPWVDKSAAMADFGDEEWPGMCCVETVNCLGGAVRLAPGGSHTMAVRVRLV